jgi:hypothetical protein
MWMGIQPTWTSGMLFSSFAPLCTIAVNHCCYPFVLVAATCHHLSCTESTQPLLTTFPFIDLPHSHTYRQKTILVAHFPHAKSVSPTVMSSLVMHAYIVMITAWPLLVGLVKRTRHLCPPLMAGMMWMLISPRELWKRRLRVEQIAMMRCVLSISSLALLQSSNAWNVLP